MLLDHDFHSSGESEIEEDLAFPLPQQEEVDHSPPPESLAAEERGSSTRDMSPPESELDENWESERDSLGRGRRGKRGRGRGRVRVKGRSTGRGRDSARERSPCTQGKMQLTK